MDERYIETIRIHRSEMKNVVFKDRGKEFIYKGGIYDIKSRIQEGDIVVFRCINDKTEKQLLAGLHTHVKNNTDSNSSSDNKQSDSSKNPVKDLFLHTNDIAEVLSIAVGFPTAICLPKAIGITSYIGPPPEVSIA